MKKSLIAAVSCFVVGVVGLTCTLPMAAQEGVSLYNDVVSNLEENLQKQDLPQEITSLRVIHLTDMDTESVLSRFVSRRMRRFISTLPTEIRLKSPPKGSRQSSVYRSRRHWKDSSFTFPGKACSIFSARKCAVITPSSSRFPKLFPSPAAARTVSTSMWAAESSS